MRRLLSLLPMLILGGHAALADSVDVNWREARVLKLAKPAHSVVVGDPTVADVTLDDPQTVIVFGKSPGETNLLVLSDNQELLLDWPVVVTPVSARHVTVLNAKGAVAPVEVLYTCGNGRCVRVLSPSDVEFKAKSETTTTNASDASKNTTSSGQEGPSGVPGGNAGAGATDTTQPAPAN